MLGLIRGLGRVDLVDQRVALARELPRGHSRAMLASERNALVNEIDAAKAAYQAEHAPASDQGVSG